MASKLTWKDFYQTMGRLEQDVAGKDGLKGIAGDGSYDGPLATKYKKQIPDFANVKSGNNYPGSTPKTPSQAHPDDEDALGMMASPEVDSFVPHDVEKLSKIKSAGKFTEATKNLTTQQFIKVLLEDSERPSPKAISDLHGHKFTPQPYEVISYLVSLCHNSRIISRLVGELKKNGYMKPLVQELINRPDFYECIVKCMDHDEDGPKIANRFAKSMADHHISAIKDSNLAEAVSPALIDDLPPEDDDNELNAAPQPQDGTNQPPEQDSEDQGEENSDEESEENEEDDDKESNSEEEANNDGEESEEDLELSDEDSLPDDDEDNVQKESVRHKKKKKKRSGKRKLPHHHLMNAMRPYFGIPYGFPFGIHIGRGYDHDHDHNDNDNDTPVTPTPPAMDNGGDLSGED